ncbi:MAG: serine hydroxymethyltransferase, partial [Thermoplasmata archaeon]
TMDNYNISRMAGVGVALEEMAEYGREYAEKVIKNARSLAAYLRKEIGIKYSDWFTQTHQIIVDETSIKKMGYDYAKFSMALEKNGIIVDRAGRIGTSEITRMGIDDMKEISEMIIDSIKGMDVKDRVNKYINNMKMRYYESK